MKLIKLTTADSDADLYLNQEHISSVLSVNWGESTLTDIVCARQTYRVNESADDIVKTMCGTKRPGEGGIYTYSDR